ncbi:MAG: homoserine dehydrogenase [bacterium]|nr:homoserine dehydrogenase [bacterium]
MINIGLIGLGNVGGGVLRILRDNAELITQRTGRKIRVKTVVVRDPDKKRNMDLTGINISDNPEDIINDPDIKIVVEVIGGEKPACDYICSALKKGKHVVTANKEVIARYNNELTNLAEQNNADIYYEAAVGGGIPVIRSLKVGFAANKIKAVYGILNGTTNYILTKIEEEGKSFDEVLKKAQDLGFAEADPAMDISGLDAAYKLIILAAVAFKTDVTIDSLFYEGIENIKLRDIVCADELGYKIKLLATGQDLNSRGLSLKVHPALIPKSHPLAMVKNEFNAVYLEGDMVGESMLFGKGAGPFPTGSAVVSDIIDIAMDKRAASDRISRKESVAACKRVLLPIEKCETRFYIRFSSLDKQGLVEKINRVLEKNNIGISQTGPEEKIEQRSEVVMITDKVQEQDLYKAVAELDRQDFLIEPCYVIRLGLDDD